MLFRSGYCLIYVFAIELGWLPVQGYVRIGVNFGQFIERMILPSVTLSVAYIALISRITRASVLEVLNEDYIRTAHSKGLAPRHVVIRHALKNALLPVVTVAGLQVGNLLSGTVIIETMFSIPGMGRLTVNAIYGQDYALVQILVLILAVAHVLANLAADVLYVRLDPRIHY